jgi:hypothetical protein
MTKSGKKSPPQPPAPPSSSALKRASRFLQDCCSTVPARLLLLVGIGGVIVLLALTIAAMLRPGETAPPFEVVIVPPQNGGREHMAIPGWPVVLKAVVRAKPGTMFDYDWDFGDGAHERGPVTDYYNVGASHTYLDAKKGSVFHASLTVTERESKATDTAKYDIRFAEPDKENKRIVVIENGLWALHKTAHRADTAAEGQTARWERSGRYSRPYWIGITAANVYAMELAGHDLTGDESEDPYVEDVRRGLNALVQELRGCDLENTARLPVDSDASTRGITLDEEEATDRLVYQTAMVVLALAGSGAPNRKLTAGEDQFVRKGYDYKRCVRELVQYLADVQNKEGGWANPPNAPKTDMEMTQWSALAFLAAKRAMDVKAPDWTMNLLRENLTKKEGALAEYCGSPSISLTAAAITCLAACDVGAGDPIVKQAVKAIAENWPENETKLNESTMHAVSTAALVVTPRIEYFESHDWKSNFTGLLIERQVWKDVDEDAKKDKPRGPQPAPDAAKVAWLWPQDAYTGTVTTSQALVTLLQRVVPEDR